MSLPLPHFLNNQPNKQSPPQWESVTASIQTPASPPCHHHKEPPCHQPCHHTTTPTARTKPRNWQPRRHHQTHQTPISMSISTSISTALTSVPPRQSQPHHQPRHHAGLHIRTEAPLLHRENQRKWKRIRRWRGKEMRERVERWRDKVGDS